MDTEDARRRYIKSESIKTGRMPCIRISTFAKVSFVIHENDKKHVMNYIRQNFFFLGETTHLFSEINFNDGYIGICLMLASVDYHFDVLCWLEICKISYKFEELPNRGYVVNLHNYHSVGEEMMLRNQLQFLYDCGFSIRRPKLRWLEAFNLESYEALTLYLRERYMEFSSFSRVYYNDASKRISDFFYISPPSNRSEMDEGGSYFEKEDYVSDASSSHSQDAQDTRATSSHSQDAQDTRATEDAPSVPRKHLFRSVTKKSTNNSSPQETRLTETPEVSLRASLSRKEGIKDVDYISDDSVDNIFSEIVTHVSDSGQSISGNDSPKNKRKKIYSEAAEQYTGDDMIPDTQQHRHLTVNTLRLPLIADTAPSTSRNGQDNMPDPVPSTSRNGQDNMPDPVPSTSRNGQDNIAPDPADPVPSTSRNGQDNIDPDPADPVPSTSRNGQNEWPSIFTFEERNQNDEEMWEDLGDIDWSQADRAAERVYAKESSSSAAAAIADTEKNNSGDMFDDLDDIDWSKAERVYATDEEEELKMLDEMDKFGRPPNSAPNSSQNQSGLSSFRKDGK